MSQETLAIHDPERLTTGTRLADIDTIVCIKGLVIRATPIIPDMKLGAFSLGRLACLLTPLN